MNGTGPRSPEMVFADAARVTFSRTQKLALLVGAVAVVAALVLSWRTTVTVLVALATLYYFAATVDKLWLFLRGARGDVLVRVSDEEALAIPDAELPHYTVLLPVYDEPQIVRNLVAGVGQLDYPRDKLDVLLLLEADDDATIAAFDEAPADFVTPVLVPPSEPRTKPKACNYGMALGIDRGEYLTIYDAEDIPDPLQLRRAVATFRRSPDDVACVQARLGYFNERQNLLTQWFSLEYDQWFGYTLPAIEASGCVVPLGGTSNHVRTDVWRRVGGWDAFNVTEDADLGVRLAREGYRTVVLDSVTLEEANSDAVNWVRQRSRWYKGYLQTFFVHARSLGGLRRDLGLAATLRFANTTIGMPLSNVLNLVFWTGIVVWYVAHPAVMEELFPPLLYYASLALFLLGNLLTVFAGLISVTADGKPHLTVAALTAPLYWLLQSVAALKGLLQLIFKPSYWEKTVHGLSGDPETST